MSLPSEKMLGPYRIVAPLGVGGMGEVYRARDTRLDRDVAIKVLPEDFARNQDRMARFEREAKVLATLNHTNIAAVYGFEEIDGRRLLVMELAEGETLADRLRRGPMTLSDTLEIALGIAVALEAAHEKGVIHRDLKPANIKVTPSGAVKVLDFGLAKVLSGDGSTSDIANSPTLTVEYTRSGVVLGTAAYMSPEQARGRTLDKRTDIWSFGCVLYECLAGRRPFEGETTSDLIARILEREPDWSKLPPSTPPLILLLLRRCLAKDRNRRLRDIGDARVDIETVVSDPSTGAFLLAGAALHAKTGSRGIRRAMAAALGLLLLGGGAFLGWRFGRDSAAPAPAPVYRFQVDIPADYKLGNPHAWDISNMNLSPKGDYLAYSAEKDGVRHVLIHDLAAGESRTLPGTEGAVDPVFSPDGRWVAFSVGASLKKVPIAGGPAITMLANGIGDAAWLEDGTILLASNQSLSLVSPGGQVATLATAGVDQKIPGTEQLMLGFNDICAIPKADYVLVGIWDGDTIEDYAIIAVSLSDGSVRPILQDAVNPRYVEPGYLLFLRNTSILAVRFDIAEAKPIGEPFLVIDGVYASKWADDAQFAASNNGTIAYIPGGRPGPGRRLIRVTPEGKVEPLMDGPEAIVGGLRVSPDSSRLLLTTLRRRVELWSFDLQRRSLIPINKTGETWSPIWSADGQHVVFRNILPGLFEAVVRMRADGTGEPETLLQNPKMDIVPNAITPDGKYLFYSLEGSAAKPSDIGRVALDNPGQMETILGTPAEESGAEISPDGKFIAYHSNETGRFQVYVHHLGGGKWQVSQQGGGDPRWSRDGSKLYFIDQRGWMHSVDVNLEEGPTFSTPAKLFDITTVATTDLWGTYDVFPNGDFVLVEPAAWERQPLRIHVVANWISEINRQRK